MAMLAEPRRKQKFSFDPRNTNWSNDETKFGHKLMEKMGWSKGKGLGVKEDGKTENISVTLKNDTRGVGCTKSHVDNWIAHQDDFNALLANLGQDHNTGPGGSQEETDRKVLSLEQTSRSSKGRVHYQKFTKGKDLSLKSETDLDCVFGKRKNQSGTSTPQAQSGANTPQVQSEPSSDNEENTHGLITVTSTDSVQDYFKKKMAEKLNKLKGIRADTVQLEDSWNNRNKVEANEEDKECDEIQNKSKKKSKKRKLNSDDTVDQAKETLNDIGDDSANKEEVKKKKKSKKKRKNEKECENDNEAEDDEVSHVHVKENNDNVDISVKKKSKKKKRNSEVTDSLDTGDVKTEQVEERLPECDVTEESISDIKPKKKKKSKKRKQDIAENDMVTPVKQKKRVSFKLGEDDNEDLSEEKSDKSIIVSEESKLESVKKTELNRNNNDSSEDIKLCSNKGKAASSPLNNSDDSITKSCKTKDDRASDVKITSNHCKYSNRRDSRGLMAVREVKMAAQAYRGANINNVKGYSGMRITPVDVKRKLNNVK